MNPFHFKSAVGIIFINLGSAQTRNHALSLSCVFMVGALPKIKKMILKADLKCKGPYFYSKLFFSSV